MGYYKKVGDSFRYINPYGGNYDMYGALSLADVFTTTSIGSKIKKRLDAPKGKLRDIYKCSTNAQLAKIIYGEYLYMIARDVLNGDIAVLKTHGSFPAIHVGLLNEEASSEILPHIKKDLIINLRNTEYRIPKFLINFGPNSKYIDRVFHVPKRLYNTMWENIANGKVYPKISSNVIKSK